MKEFYKLFTITCYKNRFRLNYINFIFTFCCLCSFYTAANAATFTSQKSGDWNNPCTWANLPGCPNNPPAALIGVNIPGPSDDVIISNKDVVNVNSDVSIRNLTIDNGTGNSITSINIIGDVTFVINGKLIIDRHGTITIDGGAFVNVKGDICVKNNGNIAVKGVAPSADSYFLVEGCSSSGSIDCSTVDSNPPTFIQGEYLIWCIACKGNPSATYEGTPGACHQMLPVEFISFTASYGKNYSIENTPAVLLTWLVASEQNNKYFTLERSTNASSFEPIAQIEGRGTTSYHSSYQFQDVKPLPNVSYYRLRQTDTDGKYTFSKVVAVAVPAEDIGLLSLAPNPCDGREVTIYFAAANALWIDVVDMYGNKIDKSSYSLESSISQARLRFHHPLKSGVYYLKVRLDEKRASSKFMVY